MFKDFLRGLFCYNAVVSLAFWVCAAVTLISALTSIGFSVATLVSSDGKAQVNAMYASSRSAALVVVSVVVLFDHSRSWLEALAVSMIIVQLLDTVIGVKIQDKMKTYGPAVTALVNLVVLIWFIH
jgi:hypothetical protein